MSSKATNSSLEAAPQQIDVEFKLRIPGLANVQLRRALTLSCDNDKDRSVDQDRPLDEAELARLLDQEHVTFRQISQWFLRIAQWKQELQAEIDRFMQQNVSMHLDLEADSTRLTVSFRAEYLVDDFQPLVHPVTFPIVGEVPSVGEVIHKLDQEWAILRRVFTIAHAGGDGKVTRAMPLPFVDSKVGQKAGAGAGLGVQLARVATPEEAKRLTERYLDLFRFPIEVEENGVRYGFIPRVEICGGGAALKLTVTLLMPPAGARATFMKGGFKAVELPIDEVYIQGDRLNRRTQEGILAIVKELCRAIGREKGMKTDIDITRPR